LFERGQEAEERNLLLADVGMHAQRDLAADVAHAAVRRQGHLHVVADATDVHDQSRRLLLEQPAAQGGNHRCSRSSGRS
jgi:hypothetical protein